MNLWVAIGIGFIGSAHCLGMCAPVLMAVNPLNRPWYSFLHHAGRLLTYASMGAIAGGIGHSFNILGHQQTFSVVIGSMMVATVLLVPFSKRLRVTEAWISKIAVKFNGWIHQQGFSVNLVRFLAGVGNGILPCGLVYMAVAGAAGTFTPWSGAFFMLLFGVGTLPVLLGASLLSSQIGARFRHRLRKLVPLSLLVMGSLLFVRGMNLGIPFVSPQNAPEPQEVPVCGTHTTTDNNQFFD